MQQSANPITMDGRNHDVSAFLGGLSEAKVRKAARKEERATGGKAMITLVESGLFFNRERAVPASEVSAAELNAAKSVSISVKETGLARVFSYPVLAEGVVDRGVARVSDKAHRRAGPAHAVTPYIPNNQNRAPEMREAFENTSMVRMIRAVQEQASNNNRAGVAARVEAVVDAVSLDNVDANLVESPRFRALVDFISGETSQDVSLFNGASRMALISMQSSQGVTAADIYDAVRPDLRVALFAEFLRVAAANKDGPAGRGLAGGYIVAPVLACEANGGRIARASVLNVLAAKGEAEYRSWAASDADVVADNNKAAPVFDAA